MVGRATWLIALVIACGTAGSRSSVAEHCGGPGFAFGNAGYGAGYSISGVRGGGCGWWSGGSVCGPRWWDGCGIGGWPACGRGGWRVGGWPDCGRGGWSFGWPGFGFGGCFGARRWCGYDSIYLSVPPGGGATFFSGGCVPYVGGWPMNWYPGVMAGPWGWYPYAVPAPVGVGPQFGPAGILPFLGAATSRPAAVGAVAAAPTRRAVAVRAAAAPRVVNEASRRRAERLVALGDRHLREARGNAPARARLAVDAYRRAAKAAPDDPDIRIREALALVALGDADGADAAIGRATAIDGRLALVPPQRDGVPADPVFGGRPAGAPTPLAARGATLLREIGGVDGATVEWLAARWNGRWADAVAAVASR